MKKLLKKALKKRGRGEGKKGYEKKKKRKRKRRKRKRREEEGYLLGERESSAPDSLRPG